MWESIQYVGTGLGLVAFVVAAIFLYLRSAMSERARMIESAAEGDRLKAISATAEFFNVDVTGLPQDRQAEIILLQIHNRSRRDLILAGLFGFVAVLLAGIAILSILRPSQATAESSDTVSSKLATCKSQDAYFSSSQSKIVASEYASLLKSHLAALSYSWSGGTEISPSSARITDVIADGTTLFIRYDWQDGLLALVPVIPGGTVPVVVFEGYWRQKNGAGCMSFAFPLIDEGDVIALRNGKSFAVGFWNSRLNPFDDGDEPFSATIECEPCLEGSHT